MQSLQQQGQRQRRRVRRRHGGGKQVSGRRLGVQPGGAHHHARLLIESAGQIQHRRAGAQRIPPVLAGLILRAAEKGEVNVVKGVGGDGLEKGNLVAHLLQLALRLFLIEQDNVGRGQR